MARRIDRSPELVLATVIAAIASSCGGAQGPPENEERCAPVTFDVGVRICPLSENVSVDDLRELRDRQAQLEKLHGGQLSVRVDGIGSVEFLVGATKDELLSILGPPEACQREMFENELPFTGDRVSMEEMLAGKMPEEKRCGTLPVWVYDFGFLGEREAMRRRGTITVGGDGSWSIYLEFDASGTCVAALKYVPE